MRTFIPLACILLGACGSSDPAASVAPRKERSLVAKEVMFEEKTSDGRLNWSLEADELVNDSAVTRAREVALLVMKIDTSPAAAAKFPTALEAGARATARRGAMSRRDSVTVVALEDGFEMSWGDGWNAYGQKLEWNGSHISTSETVTLTRGASMLQGSSAAIDPRSNHIVLSNVSGVLDGPSL